MKSRLFLPFVILPAMGLMLLLTNTALAQERAPGKPELAQQKADQPRGKKAVDPGKGSKAAPNDKSPRKTGLDLVKEARTSKGMDTEPNARAEQRKRNRDQRVRIVHLHRERQQHSKRLAQIERIRELGVESDNPTLVQRADALREKEMTRYQRKVKAINANPDPKLELNQ